MNSQRDLYKRLLRLFPIQHVREYFNETGRQDDVNDSITGKSGYISAVRTFAETHFSYTKQDIYILHNPRRNFPDFDVSDFPVEVLNDVTANGERKLFCLPKITYTLLLLTEPPSKADVSFFQPLQITIRGRIVIISFTKLKRDVEILFPSTTAKVAAVNTDESKILSDITEFLQPLGSEVCDINRGVKDLWHNDIIDCQKLIRKDTHSTETSNMDGELTFKQRYPERYEEVRYLNLNKTHFKYLLEDELFCEKFITDPSLGYISIHRSPKTVNQVYNVITAILAAN